MLKISEQVGSAHPLSNDTQTGPFEPIYDVELPLRPSAALVLGDYALGSSYRQWLHEQRRRWEVANLLLNDVHNPLDRVRARLAI